MDEKEFNELVAKLEKATGEKVTKQVKEALKALDTESLKGLLEKDLVVKTELEKAIEQSTKSLNKQVKELQEELKFVKDNQGSESRRETLAKEIASKKEQIKGLVNGETKEVTLKANTVRASIANNTESVRLPDIGQLGYKRRALYDYFSKFPVGSGNHNGTISYIDWDEATTVKAAAMVAEGAQFPESTAKFQEYTQKLRKVGDTLPVSEEFGEDEQLAAAELDNFLRINVNSEIDRQIAVGSGAGENLEGLFTRVPAFTATPSSIPDANIKDLVRKMRTDIVKTRGSKYAPNFVAANSDVIDQYILKKDQNNNYMFDMNTGQIAGLDIVEDNNLDDNTLVVGDGRFGRIYEMGGVTLSEGTIDKQFTGDFKTLKARSRLLFLIRNVDLTGFNKSTDIDADLTTLASDPA